ncbi:hypothetical protein EV188_10562 [Actinomycetospora succinea]|uniref:Uncharacterized protein n=1 Tax=Actinomycetospora succinea TaxID=663603 RepID=A0A4R6V8Y1_9PSEU|nr:hypothetical protein [Actinomycetospora succinea]TDQ55666.1 hypothetical protein EV188_10562 [Actinomycetospora succinea]
MGRRRRDGQRRAAKVEARRLRRTRPPHTRATRGAESRVTAPLLSDCELIEQFPHAFDDDWDDELDLWDEEEDDDEEDDAALDELRERIREIVVATVEQRDPEIARAAVGWRERVLVDVVVGAWLAKARRRFPQRALPSQAVAWVAAHLGEAGQAVQDAARLLGPEAPAALREHFLRVPDDVSIARIWLLAAVIAPSTDDAVVDLLLADDHR